MGGLANPVVGIILLLGLLIVVHELGHFLVGRMLGIAVEVFSIGFGPVLFEKRVGPTAYRLSVVPLGGFVKFYGATRHEDVPLSVRGQEFYRAAVWKRMLTVVAGPVANFLLAVVTYTILVMYGLPQLPATVGEIIPHSPAEKAGFHIEDKVTAINGEAVQTWKDLQRIIVEAPGRRLDFTVQRDGQSLTVPVTPEEIKDEELIGRKTRGQIGISPGFIPPVITVTDPNSLAGRAGLQTGDRLVKATIGDEVVDLRHFRQINTAILSAQQKHLPIQFSVKRPTTLTVAPESTQPVTVSLVLPEKGEGTLEQLGIRDSQLTVAAYNMEKIVPLKPGDVLTHMAGVPIHTMFDLRDQLLANKAPTIAMQVIRDGQEQTLNVDLKPTDIQKLRGKETVFALDAAFLGQLEQPETVTEQIRNPFMAIAYGGEQTWTQVKMIAKAIGGLFTGDMPIESLGGPISIAKVASDSVRMGWMSFLSALGLVSVNLGLLNLFPIPVLDGGQFCLLLAEGIKRRPLADVTIENFQKIGFIMVFALVIMATYNDLSRFWSSMIGGLSGG